MKWLLRIFSVTLFSLFLALFLYHSAMRAEEKTVAAAEKSDEKSSDKEKKEEKREEKKDKVELEIPSVPRLPSGKLTLSQSLELREKLEYLQKDIEVKIAELKRAKTSYDRSKQDVDFKLKRIQEERVLLEETLQKEKKAKEERLNEALQFMVKMDPRKAGPMIETMDRDLVLHLLRKLPAKQVSALLSAVNPKKAAEIMEFYTRIRSGREYEMLKELGLCQAPGQEDLKPLEKETPKKATENKVPEATKEAKVPVPTTATPETKL